MFYVYFMHLTHYSCTLLLLLLLWLIFFYFFHFCPFLVFVFFIPFCYLFIIIIFILKRENENILNYKKLQKIRKKSKKWKMLSFVLLCLSSRPHRVTLIFKNIKNSFLSLLVFVRPLTSYDTYFQVIQKTPKNTKFSKYKISIFSNKKVFFLRTTWSLILHREIRRSKAKPCQVHL